MNKELETRSTDREALDREEEEKVEGRVEVGDKMRFSTDLGDCRHRSPSSSWPYLACRDLPVLLPQRFLAVRKLKYRRSNLRGGFYSFDGAIISR
jgi:hypothetical protein